MKTTVEENEEAQVKYHRTGDDIRFVQENIPFEELLCQLAEECNELGKAALKLRRTYSNANPTPVKRREALNALIEEIADVKLCLHVCGFEDVTDKIRVNRIITEKAKRWVARLEEASRNGR